MGILSTLLGSRDRGAYHPDKPVTFRLASANEVESSIRLVLAGPQGQISQAQLQDFIGFVQSRQSQPAGPWVAEQEGRILQAVLPIVGAGRTVLLLAPPRPEAGPAEHLLKRLLECACRDAAKKDARLAQALIDPEDQVLQRALCSAEFKFMAELIYLQSEPRVGCPAPSLASQDHWVNYSPQTHGLFAQTIEATYRNSLDCPALNGMRDIQDVIEGHKAAGDFDPRLWFVLCRQQQPMGVLLLAISNRNDLLELVYLGLTPEARGTKLSQTLLRQALAMTAQKNRTRLTLAVDSRNIPALKLYYRGGLSRLAAKNALMRGLSPLAV